MNRVALVSMFLAVIGFCAYLLRPHELQKEPIQQKSRQQSQTLSHGSKTTSKVPRETQASLYDQAKSQAEKILTSETELIEQAAQSGQTTFQDLELGRGQEVSLDQTIMVHYTIRTNDGEVFLSSKDLGSPISVNLQSNVIEGLRRGLKGMRVGGKRHIYVPSSEGYDLSEYSPDIYQEPMIIEIQILSIAS